MRRITLMACLCLLLTSAGCHDRRPVDTLGIVASLSFDLAAGGELNVVAYRPLFEVTSREHAHVLTTTAPTLVGAMSAFERKENKRLVTGKTRSVFFGRDLAEAGILPLLSQLDQVSDFSTRAALAVVDGPAIDIVRFQPPEDQRVGLFVSDTLDQASTRQIIPKITFADAMIRLGSTESDLYLPLVAYLMDKEHHELDMKGLAVFRRGQMVGTLDLSEAVPVWLLTQRVSEVTYDLPPAELADSPFSLLSFTLRGKRLRVDTEAGGRNPGISIRLQVTLDLVNFLTREGAAQPDYERPEMTPELLAQTEAFLAEYLRQQIVNVVGRCQTEFGADIFGFGERFRVQHLAEYQKRPWKEVFPQATVKCEVSVHLREFEGLNF